MSFGETQNCKIFVGGLNINTTTEGLKSYFETYGNIVDAIVMSDPNTKRSKCFGFVTFESSECVDAVQAGRPHLIDEKEVDTKRAISKDDKSLESRVPCKKIFVGGLRKEIDDEDMKEYFSQFGNIAEALLVKDKVTGASRGFGFVTFDDTDAVDKIIIARPHKIKDSKADVKKALSKDEMASLKTKQAPQQNSWNNGNAGNDPYAQQGYGAQGGYGGGYGNSYGAPQGGYGAPQGGYGGWSDPSAQSWQQPAHGNGAAPTSGAPAAQPFGAYDQQYAYGGGPVHNNYSAGPRAAAPYQQRR